jgi:hypothetical protein
MAMVVWLDATRTDETITATEKIGIKRKTVCWVLRDDAEGVVVAMSKDGNDYERGFTIPRSYIKKVVKLDGQ